MSDFKVLIVGAGIAGSVAAYWIGKTGAQVTVTEKTSELRTVGQGLDMQGASKEVIKRMGVFEAIKDKATKESGAAFVDADNQVVAAFDETGEGLSPTSEIEIMRKDLAEILYRAAVSIPSVTFKFNTEFVAMDEEEGEDKNGVKVEFADGSSRTYDLVIGADGLGSRTRKILLGPEAFKESFKPVGAYVSYFSIPAEPQDGPRARWYTTTGHRTIAIRPYTKEISSVYFITATETPTLQKAYASGNQALQKQVIADHFKDVPFVETQRVINAMMAEPNFYFQRVTQIKIPPSSWSGSGHGKGRITLIGDAGYSPSPFTGQGTSLAILGAYFLSCEVATAVKSKQDGEQPDVRQCLAKYAEKMAPFVEEGQQIPLWGYMPQVINPGTWLGVWALRTVIWAFDRLRLVKLLNLLPDSPIATQSIPDFPC